jgi:hypothetical protein
MYQTNPTLEAPFLALCCALDGLLCNLSGEYRAETADVLWALMEITRKPLTDDDAVQYIARRMRDLLRELHAKEKRRQRWQGEYATSFVPTHTKPVLEARLDIVRAVNRLKSSDQAILVAAEIEERTSAELMGVAKIKNEGAAKARRKAVRGKFRDELEKSKKSKK